MTQENLIKLILLIVSSCIFLGILISIPFRSKYILKKAGKKIISMKDRQFVLSLLIIIFSAALILIVGIKHLAFSINLITCMVALLGGAIGSQELALRNKCGVYENGIIGPSNFLPVKEIYGVSELGWTEEERNEHDRKVIHIVTDKKGTVPFICDSEEQAEEILAGIIKICPSLEQH